MSATVRNPEDLGGWITQVHGECETIRTLFRPVPLTWHFCHSTAPPSDDSSRPPAPARLLPLLNEGGRKINPALLPPRARFALDDEGEAWGRWDGASRGKVWPRA
jgi:superfamily II RNA helicase